MSDGQGRGCFLKRGRPRLNPARSLVCARAIFWKPGTLGWAGLNVDKNTVTMSRTVNEYKTDIIKVLKAHRLYSKGLDAQVLSLASAMRNLEMANEQIDTLGETTVLEKTRYGEKLAPHPVFKIAKEAQELITRQMKALGLTAEALAGEVEEDPLADLTRKLAKRRRQPKIIKPGAAE